MRFFFILITIILVAAGCGKDQGPVKFEMEYLNNSFEIQAGLDVFQFHYYVIDDIPTQIEGLLSLNNASREDIVSILPSSCTIRNISSGSGFDFLREISVRIFDPDNPSDRFEIFYNDLIDLRAGSVLQLFPNENDRKDFLLKDQIGIEVQLQLRDAPREFITTRLDFSFDAR